MTTYKTFLNSFIKLTAVDFKKDSTQIEETKIYVHPEEISVMRPYENATSIIVVQGQKLMVRESITTICTLADKARVRTESELTMQIKEK